MAMDFISGPTNTNNTVATTATPRTPDSDTDTPPPQPPPAKRVHHYHHHHGHQQHVSYKECLKNHAASIGGHALDGCCEFMPGPTANLSDPTSLTCAACGCHRNFHRRDPDDPTPLHHLVPSARKPYSPPSASHLLLSHSPSAPSDHEILPTLSTPNGSGVGGGGQNGHFLFHSKKRFRTKFRPEQKDQMHEFSEKIGWKLKKGEERLVEEFCKQVGVERSVFKVWMHNNKHSSSTASAGASSHNIVETNTTETTTTTSSITINGNHGTSDNAVGVNNCGGLDFTLARGGGHEAKAQ